MVAMERYPVQWAGCYRVRFKAKPGKFTQAKLRNLQLCPNSDHPLRMDLANAPRSEIHDLGNIAVG